MRKSPIADKFYGNKVYNPTKGFRKTSIKRLALIGKPSLTKRLVFSKI